MRRLSLLILLLPMISLAQDSISINGIGKLPVIITDTSNLSVHFLYKGVKRKVSREQVTYLYISPTLYENFKSTLPIDSGFSACLSKSAYLKKQSLNLHLISIGIATAGAFSSPPLNYGCMLMSVIIFSVAYVDDYLSAEWLLKASKMHEIKK